MNELVAVIFGGTGGIGSALSRRLVAADWQVIVASRNEERLNTLGREIGARPQVADATNPSDVERVFTETERQFGRIDAVANCVGSILLKPAHLTTDEDWYHTISQNLNSAFHVLRAAVKRMRKSGGSIALCSSAAAQIGLANHEAIAAAKAGVIGLARSAAATYATSRIRVNAVAPGLVDTAMARRITSNEASLKFSLEMHPLGRIGQPEDVASALLWLLSPEQSWVTGQVIGVEGGLASLKNH